MNLLDKKISLGKIFKPGLLLLVSVFLGCDSQTDLGVSYPLSSDANLQIKEFTLESTNIFFDSLRTDGEGKILVGKSNDPITGRITAEGYFQFFYESGPLPRAAASDSSPNPQDTLKVDSVVLIIEADASLPLEGDFFQEFTMYDLFDSLDNRGVYLSSFKQNQANEIGSFSSSINSVTDTIYRLRFSDFQSSTIFQQLGDIAEDPTRIVATEEFKSFGLFPSDQSNGISSFDLTSDTTRIILYTSPTRSGAKDTTYLISLRPGGVNYSYLGRDRSSSQIANIKEFEDFSLDGGQTLIEPLSGVSTSISLEPLIDFFQSNGRIIINNAILSFEFQSESTRDTLEVFTNFRRKLDGSFFGPSLSSNSFSNIVMTDNGYLTLSLDPILSEFDSSKTRILQNPTLFFQQLYRPFLSSSDQEVLKLINPSSGQEFEIRELVLIGRRNVSLERTVFKPNGIKLKIYYTEIDQ